MQNILAKQNCFLNQKDYIKIMANRDPDIKINYIYFGLFFVFLLLISVSNLFAKEDLHDSKIFFFFYALGQSLLEVSILISLGWIIKRLVGSFGFSIFIGFTFIFLILHFLDFLVERILDLSIWETLSFVFNESLSNFFYLLDASGISLWVWGLLFLLFLLIPFLGVLIYFYFEKLSRNKPLFVKKELLFQALLCIPLTLILCEYSSAHIIIPNTYTNFVKSIPWKFTFLQPKTTLFALSHSLKEPIDEKEVLANIEKNSIQLNSKPNIYLFVIESFREDFITSEIAPSLNQFKEGAHHFDLALSNANGTHLSWFSLFHSQFPYYWNRIQKENWQMGSPSIHLLKKWGYQVRLYTSAQLNYYGMEQLLFGEKRHLVDKFQPFYHGDSLKACDADALALDQLIEDLKEPELQNGQLIIVFLDSPHFNYSWPKSTAPKFSPIASNLDYFKFFHSKKNIAKIQNNYKNAIFHIDSLFKKFMRFMPKKEESIIVVTGDHGEEFFEHGKLFHCSHLVHEQTNIPLYMKFGKEKGQSHTGLVSQMDVFPSILHYLSNEEASIGEGQSIFSENRWPYVLISRFNASRSPYEFCMHNGKYKCIAQFSNRQDIFQSTTLKIHSVCDYRDKHFCHSEKNTIKWIQNEFGDLINRIFSHEEKTKLKP